MADREKSFAFCLKIRLQQFQYVIFKDIEYRNVQKQRNWFFRNFTLSAKL